MMRIEELKRGLIVSCQALPDEPMRSSDIMARFALAAQMGGAVGVRLCGSADITAARQLVHIPVIGLIKRHYAGYWCYITPTLRDVDTVYHTGAEIVAVDATSLPKPGGVDAAALIGSIKEKYPDLLVMADVATQAEGVAAEAAGADLVSTTLSGYAHRAESPGETLLKELEPPDIDLVAALAGRLRVPVVAEGRYWDETLAGRALAAGAHNVVIGAGITRPQIITRKIVEGLPL